MALKIVSLLIGWSFPGLWYDYHELGFPWLFGKINVMSDICELKSHFCHWNSWGNVVYFCSYLSYHKRWIWYSLRQALNIFFLQILHAINKAQLCCSVFSIKTCLRLVLHVGELVWPFVNFFVSFLCIWLFIIFSICLRDFLIRFETNFHYCPLISHSVFWSFPDRQNFTLIIAMTAKAIACI